MRSLMNTVILSIPRLQDIALMMLFLFMIFGILGTNFWGGLMHRLCRVTPQPLVFSQNCETPTGMPQDGWCFDDRPVVRTVLLESGATANLNSSVIFQAFCNRTDLDEECVKAY